MSAAATGPRGLWRQWLYGASTLLGRPRGYFIPSRYPSLQAPRRYPALEPAFIAASPEFRRGLATIARYVPALAAIDGPPPAPRFDQDWFPRLDAAMAYALVRDTHPATIIEIGSGHSTRFMARAIRDGGLATRFIAIDPAPRAAIAGLEVAWHRAALQAVESEVFRTLAAGDILFVDSSHVLMPGSDVDRVLNDVLPQLPSGVRVHFHDILLPDGYPTAWTWRGYNEQNAIAILLGGGGWRLTWSSHWVASRMSDEVAQAGLGRLPLPSGAIESSLWLKKA